MKFNRKIGLLVALGALAFGCGVVYLLIMPPPPPVAEVMPNPNGYDDFVAAGGMLTSDAPDSKTVTAQELRDYLATNRAALERGRLGVTRECRVSMGYSEDFFNRHINDMIAIKRLAGAFAAEGKLSDMENRPGEAATNYLMAIKLGAGVAHGAVVINALVAVASEARGSVRLAADVEKLSASESRALARELETVNSGREPTEKIVGHEGTFSRNMSRGLLGSLQRLLEQRATSAMLQKSMAKYNQQCLRTTELEVALAEHAFELEKGHTAKGWNDLVPEYLKSIPLEPGTTNQLNHLFR